MLAEEEKDQMKACYEEKLQKESEWVRLDYIGIACLYHCRHCSIREKEKMRKELLELELKLQLVKDWSAKYHFSCDDLIILGQRQRQFNSQTKIICTHRRQIWTQCQSQGHVQITTRVPQPSISQSKSRHTYPSTERHWVVLVSCIRSTG